uniref:Putative secreted protein n=1 Tax=Anopheles darlingi TaxID=43151 RepID=A0A2M4D2Y5_ANODA
MRQLRYVDAHVVVQLIFVLKVLPAHIALVLADGVVVVVLSLLLPWGLHRPDELFLVPPYFGDFRHRAHIVLRVLFLHLDDEAFR